MSVEDHTVSFSLEVNVKQAEEDVRRLQMILYRTLGLVRRASGNEDLNSFIASLQETIAWANRLRLALLALQAARMAAGDPLAWATAALAVGEIAMDTVDKMGSLG